MQVFLVSGLKTTALKNNSMGIHPTIMKLKFCLRMRQKIQLAEKQWYFKNNNYASPGNFFKEYNFVAFKNFYI